jgi:hypothetical protein
MAPYFNLSREEMGFAVGTVCPAGRITDANRVGQEVNDCKEKKIR